MATKKYREQRTGDKVCAICGRKAAARANGVAWLCAGHAHEVVMLSLMCGQPVVGAIQGEPQYLLMPTLGTGKN